jgi:hypothetical protein
MTDASDILILGSLVGTLNSDRGFEIDFALRIILRYNELWSRSNTLLDRQGKRLSTRALVS